MKKLIVFAFAFALAIAGAAVTKAHSKGMMLSAYEQVSTNCNPVTVDDVCSTSGTKACAEGRAIFLSNSPCSIPLYRP